MSKKKGLVKVTIYPAWCKGCGICVAFCPAQVLQLGADGKAHVVRESECISCGFCELHCPDFAISVTPQKRQRIKAQLPSEKSEDKTSTTEPVPSPEQAVGTPNLENNNGQKKT
ncbi:MAG: 4Fe-4S binding protein [Desulfomicrobium sp.]|jgi:2-oxoglutarate ferredoxin oxidoreductase subunit delta|nr:4Fe-4S binding protein [Desulfomicrobium sp.]